MPSQFPEFISWNVGAGSPDLSSEAGACSGASMSNGLDYHHNELALALDPLHPAHLLPPIPGGAKRILDVGCGMGQSLMALRFEASAEAWGIDRDEQAIKAGHELSGGKLHLVVGAGEQLPFPDASFDFVYSRVALPYMMISTALAEISRVLRPEGELWAALHPPMMLMRRIYEDLRHRRLRDLGFCGFVALNSIYLRAMGKQFCIRNHCETVQTRSGFAKLLRSAGLEPLPVGAHPGHFLVRARKPEQIRSVVSVRSNMSAP
jgi:ubiquinone/menaquinone biosynthesis C-methylase UbiE